MKLRQYLTEEILSSYKEAVDWIEKKSKEYGGKNKFLSSDEYKKMYPIIKNLHDIEKMKTASKAEKAMKEVGAKFGDRVRYDYVSPFMNVAEYTGTIINKNGIPYVKLDKGQKSMKGKSTVPWHKGWKKI